MNKCVWYKISSLQIEFDKEVSHLMCWYVIHTLGEGHGDFPAVRLLLPRRLQSLCHAGVCESSDSGCRFITGESWVRRGIIRSWEHREYTEGRRLNKMSEHSLHTLSSHDTTQKELRCIIQRTWGTTDFLCEVVSVAFPPATVRRLDFWCFSGAFSTSASRCWARKDQKGRTGGGGAIESDLAEEAGSISRSKQIASHGLTWASLQRGRFSRISEEGLTSRGTHLFSNWLRPKPQRDSSREVFELLITLFPQWRSEQ